MLPGAGNVNQLILLRVETLFDQVKDTCNIDMQDIHYRYAIHAL